MAVPGDGGGDPGQPLSQVAHAAGRTGVFSGHPRSVPDEHEALSVSAPVRAGGGATGTGHPGAPSGARYGHTGSGRANWRDADAADGAGELAAGSRGGKAGALPGASAAETVIAKPMKSE